LTYSLEDVLSGVGPITDIWLLHNTVTAAWLQAGPPPRPVTSLSVAAGDFGSSGR
jgi:hypothetical protein